MFSYDFYGFCNDFYMILICFLYDFNDFVWCIYDFYMALMIFIWILNYFGMIFIWFVY